MQQHKTKNRFYSLMAASGLSFLSLFGFGKTSKAEEKIQTKTPVTTTGINKPENQQNPFTQKQKFVVTPLSQDQRDDLLYSVFKSISSIGEGESFSFYRCTSKKVTVGYGSNVEDNKSLLNDVYIFRQLTAEEAKKLYNDFIATKEDNQINALLKDTTPSEGIGTVHDFFKKLTKLDNNKRQEALKNPPLWHFLSQEEKNDFVAKFEDKQKLPDSILKTYAVTRADAEKMRRTYFDQTKEKVKKFFSNEQGASFFDELPVAYQAICLDLSYQTNINSYKKFRAALCTALDEIAFNEINVNITKNGVKTPDVRRNSIRKAFLCAQLSIMDYYVKYITWYNKGCDPTKQPQKPDYTKAAFAQWNATGIEAKKLQETCDLIYNVTGNKCGGYISQAQINREKKREENVKKTTEEKLNMVQNQINAYNKPQQQEKETKQTQAQKTVLISKGNAR